MHKPSPNSARLETLLQNLPGMAYRCLNLAHWPMEFVSDGCFELCGYHRHELENQAVLWGDFTHPEMIDEVDKKVRAAAGMGEPFEIEYRIICRSGEQKWVWERGRVVDTRDDGVAILEGLITDITSRKQTETALLQAKAFAQAVVESAIEAVITVDRECNIESFNQAAQAMFAQSSRSLQGSHARHLICPAHYRKFDHYFQSIQNRPQHKSRGIELDGCQPLNIDFPIHLSINPINTELDQKYVILIRDLTEQRAAEKEAREQRDMLAHLERLNTLGEMATGIAHEINQPLTAISMYAQAGLKFLQQPKHSSDRLQEALEKLSIQAHRAGAVIERMQEMTKQQESHREVTNCQRLVEEVVKLAEVEAQIRNFIIVLKHEKNLPDIICDPVQIQQVMLNLLRNGMQSMKSKGCRAGSKIILQTNSTQRGVKISIIDIGGGIAEDISGRLYQPFTSTRESGMGMGLSISRSIISAHSGQLEYANNKAAGATFYFTLATAVEDINA
ncbi:MAG: two-component system sensor kinase FixL [Gammaproteobacteria bacterium]|jgi:two-component system sensor kinase FixL